jgi:hypothetical protein
MSPSLSAHDSVWIDSLAWLMSQTYLDVAILKGESLALYDLYEECAR